MFSGSEQSELSLLREENKNLKKEKETLLSRVSELEKELKKARTEARHAKDDLNWEKIVNSPGNPFFRQSKRR